MTTLTPQICPSGLPFAAASAPAPAPDHDPAALLPTRPLCSTSSSTNSSSKGISVDLDDERVFDAFSDERIFDALGSSSECPGSPCLDSDERLEAFPNARVFDDFRDKTSSVAPFAPTRPDSSSLA